MRRLAAALVASVLAALVLQPAPALAATTAVPTLTVAPQGGGLIRTDRGLAVDVVVTNAGATALPAGELTFSADRAPVASTSALTRSLASLPYDLQGNLLARTRKAVPAVAAGATQRVRVQISAQELKDTISTADGARLLYARLRSGGQRIIGQAVVTRMGASAPSIGFGTVVPITAPPNTAGVVDVATQQTLTASGGAWDGALRAAEAMPSATVALDPEVIASIRLAGDGAPSSATRFLADLQGLPNPVVELPYADGDLTLQRATGVDAPLSPTSFAGASAAAAPQQGTASPTPAPTQAAGETATVAQLTEWDWSPVDVAWPVPGTTDADALADIGADGRWVLLGTGDLRDTAQRVAAGPRSRIDDVGVLVADATTSGLLARAATGGDAGDAALAVLTGVLATDAVTDGTAAVLAVPSRGGAPGALPKVLGLLADQRWIEGRSLPDVTAASGTSPGVGLRAGGAVPVSRASTARPVVEAEAAVRSLGSGIDEPGSVVGPSRLALLAMLSTAWRSDEQGWASAAPTVAGGMRDVLGRVRITSRGPITALGTDGEVQVSLQNGLDEPVTVRVQASAGNGRLQFTDDEVTATIPAGSGGNAKLPARTITNGRVVISLQLRTADGVALGPPVTREVTVRAGFDTIVAVLLLVALGGLLAVGVYRNVKRRTRKRA